MKMVLRGISLSLFLTAGCLWAEDEIPAAGEYAWQFPIIIEESAEYIEAQIPLETYRAVSDSHLRDIGVYDGNGHAVPRVVRSPEEDPDDVETRLPLGFIPLYGEPGQNQDRLKLLMESSQAGMRLEFNSNASPTEESAQEPDKSLHAYIVDLRSLEEETFSELEFDWSDTTAGFIGGVVVEHSNDLAQWRSAGRGTLADIGFSDNQIISNRVEIASDLQDFLRITWRDIPEDWQLNAITGIRSDRGPDSLRNWMSVSPVESSEDGREFIFDLGGHPPIDRIGLKLSGQNVVVRAAVEYRSSPEASWRRAHQGLFYTISREGNQVSSAPAKMAKFRTGHWRVRILSGRVEGDVQLTYGWLPEKILFLAQGEPPYTLVAGRAQDAVENYPQHRLLGDSSLFAMLLDTSDPGRASIGLRAEAAGMTAMEGARTWTWRTVLVWIGLIAAVAFVGWLVWSLMRENRA